VKSSQGCDLPNLLGQSYLGGGINALKPNIRVTLEDRGEHTLLAKKAQENIKYEVALVQEFVLNMLGDLQNLSCCPKYIRFAF